MEPAKDEGWQKEGERLMALIFVINSAKYRVNNLFQLDHGGWQANLTDGKLLWDFGRGLTPFEALNDAWSKVVLEGVPGIEPGPYIQVIPRAIRVAGKGAPRSKSSPALQSILALDLDL